MASEIYINKIKLLLNSDGKYSEEEIIRIANTLLRLYKTIQKVMENEDYNKNGSETTTNTTK